MTSAGPVPQPSQQAGAAEPAAEPPRQPAEAMPAKQLLPAFERGKDQAPQPAETSAAAGGTSDERRLRLQNLKRHRFHGCPCHSHSGSWKVQQVIAFMLVLDPGTAGHDQRYVT